MKIIKTGKILLAIVFVGIFSIIAIRAVVSKTPKDININPIYEFKVEGDFAGIEELAKKFGEEAKRDKWDQDKTSIIASLPKGKVEDNSYDVFRSVNIFQFRTKQRAQKDYISHRQIFAEQGYGRLYKEGGTEDDKYFMAYDPLTLITIMAYHADLSRRLK